MLQEVRNKAVGDLGVEDKVADQIELLDQGGGVLAEVMEDLHHLLRLHHRAETVGKRVYGLDVNQEALVGVIHLY